VIVGWEPVALLAIAPAVGQHEVMAQVNRVTRPGDEMVDVRAGRREALVAVEAPAVLDIDQNRTEHGQGGTLTTEEES
jgi:hypothetical protein